MTQRGATAARELLARTEQRRVGVAAGLDARRRAQLGQFFTPAPIAAFLAGLARVDGPAVRLLDPGAGVGSLSASVTARALGEPGVAKLSVTAFEVDSALQRPLAATMSDCAQTAAGSGRLVVECDQRGGDFIEWATDVLGAGLFITDPPTFDLVVMNPPYKKIAAQSRERRRLAGVGIEATNLYTAFLALAARLLAPGGQLVAITPRSFCNGPYFKRFRADFLAAMALRRLHVYESRSAAFADAAVLQENVVLSAVRDGTRATVTVSSSDGATDDHDDSMVLREVPYREVVRPEDPERFIHVVPDSLGSRVAARFTRLAGTLADLGVRVSTGRVVDFRARAQLRADPQDGTAPLIYPGHLVDGAVQWPKPGAKKPNALAVDDATAALLMPAGTYVLVKRFSAKEEPRRVVAAVHEPERVPGDLVAFENHLNVYHRDGAGLPALLARGLAAYLNSTLVDVLFRQFNGHTQVNATDLRSLRYPTVQQLEALGSALGAAAPDQHKLDQMVQHFVPELAGEEGDVDPVQVSQRVGEAVDVLRRLDLPRQQHNERSALTLLALLDLKPGTPWADASAPLRGITEMMRYFEEHYGKAYAPNTRETVRRQTVHQFLEAGLVLMNPDQPDRPVNSGKTTYQVEQRALALLQAYGTPAFDARLAAYRAAVTSLRVRWAAERQMTRIPVTLPDGSEVSLSPGGQNVLIKEVLDGFCSRFTPGGRVLYVGDADEKFAVYDRDALESLGVVVEEHGKMPDVVVHDGERNWVVLVEAVTSHGPVNPKRREELRRLFAGCRAGLIYVTAFLDRATMAKYLDDISWETEVWMAESPSHLIHFDGVRFLGPYGL